MRETTIELAGLRTVMVAPEHPRSLIVVMLHGYAMSPADLSPFAHSLGLAARMLVPEGPLAAIPVGRAWWEIDPEERTLSLDAGPRDLHTEHPPGAAAARAQLLAFLADVRQRWGEGPIALVGFSQGGMLACDALLRDQPTIAGLALLSASRMGGDEWLPLAHRLSGIPVFVSHGKRDQDLAFAAGEALHDFVVLGGANVTWIPHEHGHEIPLVVWRGLRKFLSALPNA
jgi:phospholipase/carboxylesterase